MPFRPVSSCATAAKTMSCSGCRPCFTSASAAAIRAAVVVEVFVPGPTTRSPLIAGFVVRGLLVLRDGCQVVQRRDEDQRLAGPAANAPDDVGCGVEGDVGQADPPHLRRHCRGSCLLLAGWRDDAADVRQPAGGLIAPRVDGLQRARDSGVGERGRQGALRERHPGRQDQAGEEEGDAAEHRAILSWVPQRAAKRGPSASSASPRRSLRARTTPGRGCWQGRRAA